MKHSRKTDQPLNSDLIFSGNERQGARSGSERAASRDLKRSMSENGDDIANETSKINEKDSLTPSVLRAKVRFSQGNVDEGKSLKGTFSVSKLDESPLDRISVRSDNPPASDREGSVRSGQGDG